MNNLPGTWDANLKLVYAVDQGAFFAIDTVQNGNPFDVIANLEIGDDLMAVATRYDLHVAVRNLSQSTTLLNQTVPVTLTPAHADFNEERRVQFPAGWAGTDGDVLEVVAGLKVTAGVHTDYSSSTSNAFMVSA